VDAADLLKAAAAVEQNSRHPVARAVAEVARKARLTLPPAEQFEEVAGRGVRGVVEGKQVAVGRGTWVRELLGEQDSQSASKIDAILSAPEAEGLSLLFVWRDGQLLGWIGLEDNARSSAASSIDALR